MALEWDADARFRWVLWSTAYNDQSSATAHQSPQTVFGGDYRPALRLPRFAASCHIRGRGARGLPRSGRSRFLPSAPSARARLWLLAHIGAPVPALPGTFGRPPVSALAFRKLHRSPLLISCSQASAVADVSDSFESRRCSRTHLTCSHYSSQLP